MSLSFDSLFLFLFLFINVGLFCFSSLSSPQYAMRLPYSYNTAIRKGDEEEGGKDPGKIRTREKKLVRKTLEI